MSERSRSRRVSVECPLQNPDCIAGIKLIFTGCVASNSAGLPAILQVGLSKSTVMVPSQNYVVFFSEFPKAQSLALFYFLFILMTYQMLPLLCTSYFLLTTPMYSILILV